MKTYPVAPEASNAANFLDFLALSFMNGFAFSFPEEEGEGTGANSVIGLLGIGGGSVGEETTDTGTSPDLMFLLRCISKSPIYRKQNRYSIHFIIKKKIKNLRFIIPLFSARQSVSRHKLPLQVPDIVWKE